MKAPFVKNLAWVIGFFSLAVLVVILLLRWTDQPQTPTGQTGTLETPAEITPTAPEATPTARPVTTATIAETTRLTTDTTTSSSRFISQDKAGQIAMERVGTSAQIRAVKPDFDDNPPIYEIELVDANYHYSIEIHAVTGAVLEFEKEDQDDEQDDDQDDDDEPDDED